MDLVCAWRQLDTLRTFLANNLDSISSIETNYVGNTG